MNRGAAAVNQPLGVVSDRLSLLAEDTRLVGEGRDGVSELPPPYRGRVNALRLELLKLRDEIDDFLRQSSPMK